MLNVKNATSRYFDELMTKDVIGRTTALRVILASSRSKGTKIVAATRVTIDP